MNAMLNTSASISSMSDRIASGIRHNATGAYKVDAHRGSLDSTVSKQWASRGDDERFLSFEALDNYVTQRSENAETQIVETRDMRLIASRDNLESLLIEYKDANGVEHQAAPTHYSFGQLCGLAQAPAGFLRNLPAPIAAIPLQYQIQNTRENVKTYVQPRTGELMAVNGPDYGRIKDLLLVRQCRELAERYGFKIPGMMNWADSTYNPFVKPTLESTTLYASDHDCFIFACDDAHPIEVGKLPDGSPDLLFPGFYAGNSETGAGTLFIETFYLRGVCMNRNLWGVEESTRKSFRHSKNAPHRFVSEFTPALLNFTQSSAMPVIQKVRDSKAAIVATDDDERVSFLAKQGFAKKAVADILKAVQDEEGKPAESIWDMVQGITAHARKSTNTDTRLDMEVKAGKLMERV